MGLEQVDIALYDGFFNEKASVFLTGNYYVNNTPKDQYSGLKCFVSKMAEGCVGIIGFIHEQVFESPYRAPYGGLRCEGNIDYEELSAFVHELQALLKLLQVKKIRLIQAPVFHAVSDLTLQADVFKSLGFERIHLELNHHFCLDTFSEDLSYLNTIDRNTMRRALKRPLTTKIVQSGEEKLAIYDMLKESRRLRGIPLKMTAAHLMHVATFIDLDFWGVYTAEGQICAGGVVAHVTSDMLHVIYWGFAPSYGRLDGNRVLSYHMFEHYCRLGKRYVDVGISTDRGVPNKGLIAFKENVGCKVGLRMEWVFELIS